MTVRPIRSRRRLAPGALTALLLSGCAAPPPPAVEQSPPSAATAAPSPPAAADWPQARILRPAKPLQCVPYARRVSGIPIRGDAWTWWRSAEGRYERTSVPAVGAVLVLSRSARLRGGHLAVVTGIVNDREIVVEHANWLNRGRIHKDALVTDVSKHNDWSAVRVWYTPGRQYGVRTYPVYGFILPEPPATAETGVAAVAGARR